MDSTLLRRTVDRALPPLLFSLALCLALLLLYLPFDTNKENTENKKPNKWQKSQKSQNTYPRQKKAAGSEAATVGRPSGWGLVAVRCE